MCWSLNASSPFLLWAIVQKIKSHPEIELSEDIEYTSMHYIIAVVGTVQSSGNPKLFIFPRHAMKINGLFNCTEFQLKYI